MRSGIAVTMRTGPTHRTALGLITNGTERRAVPARFGTTRLRGSGLAAQTARRFRTAATVSGDNLKPSWIRALMRGHTTGSRRRHQTDTAASSNQHALADTKTPRLCAGLFGYSFFMGLFLWLK